MNLWGIAIVISLLAFASAAQVPADCENNVKKTYEKRLANLIAEGVVVQTSEGAHQPTLSLKELYANPRFRNFPAISLQTIQWCQKVEAVEDSISFLRKVGFNPASMDQYFKRLLYRSKKISLVIRKDQVGPTFERQKFIDWMKHESVTDTQKQLVSHYAMAVYKSGDAIKARAGSNYIGNFLDQAVFTLPYHALFVKDKKISCKDFEFYFPKTPSAPLMAQTTLFVVPSMDVVFCGLKLDDRHKELKPASLNAKTLLKNNNLLTLGVGTDSATKKLALTIDASDECRTLVNEENGTLYEAGDLDTATHRWAMGCDVSEGNSGDGLYDATTGQLVAFVTSRSAYTYQDFSALIFSDSLDLERLYLETSHYVPLSQVRAETLKIPQDSLPKEQQDFAKWFLNVTEVL